jgi:hypothetical protein
MVVLVALTIGLVWWITAWSLGIKSFDAFMVTGLIIVLAATWYVARPYFRSFMSRSEPGRPG